MAYPQPTGGLIQKKIDINTASDPPSGSMYIGVDTDGTLKLRDENGVVHPVGGSGSISIDSFEIAFGTGTGLTSSPLITYGTGSFYVSNAINTSKGGSPSYIQFGDVDGTGNNTNTQIIDYQHSITHAAYSVDANGFEFAGEYGLNCQEVSGQPKHVLIMSGTNGI